MSRVIRLLLLAAALIFFGPDILLAWSWGENQKTLVVNGEEFSAANIKDWWSNWREEGMSFPETSDSLIDWLLLVQEANRMELYNEPEYKRKVEVFLNVRSLLMLKYYEIDAKTEVSDQDIMERYQKLYAPISHAQLLYFNEEQIAAQAYEALKTKALTIEDFKERAAKKGADVMYQEQKLSPIKTAESWQEIISSLEVGEVSAPLKWEEGFVIFKILERKDFDEEDYKSRKDGIGRELVKINQEQLTEELVRKLQDKYEVKVDEELFASLGKEGMPDALMEKALIITKRGNISVASFLAKVGQQQDFREKGGFSDVDFGDFKNRVLSGIISQTLTSWEAIDRHYELEPPLKPVYDFYTRHRLVKEIEKRLFVPVATVSDSEIAAYYSEHPEEFTMPELVSVAVLDDVGELADKIWAEIAMGNDIFAVAKKYFSAEIPVKHINVNDLAPEMKAAVDKLANGEVSYPFKVQDKMTLVKLVDRKAPITISLKSVAGDLYRRLRNEKIEKARNDYLAQLRSRSKIEVNTGAWRALRAELSEGI